MSLAFILLAVATVYLSKQISRGSAVILTPSGTSATPD